MVANNAAPQFSYTLNERERERAHYTSQLCVALFPHNAIHRLHMRPSRCEGGWGWCVLLLDGCNLENAESLYIKSAIRGGTLGVGRKEKKAKPSESSREYKRDQKGRHMQRREFLTPLLS